MECNQWRQKKGIKNMAYTVGLNNELDYGGARIRKGITSAQKATSTYETIAELAKLFA